MSAITRTTTGSENRKEAKEEQTHKTQNKAKERNTKQRLYQNPQGTHIEKIKEGRIRTLTKTTGEKKGKGESQKTSQIR